MAPKQNRLHFRPLLSWWRSLIAWLFSAQVLGGRFLKKKRAIDWGRWLAPKDVIYRVFREKDRDRERSDNAASCRAIMARQFPTPKGARPCDLFFLDPVDCRRRPHPRVGLPALFLNTRRWQSQLRCKRRSVDDRMLPDADSFSSSIYISDWSKVV